MLVISDPHSADFRLLSLRRFSSWQAEARHGWVCFGWACYGAVWWVLVRLGSGEPRYGNGKVWWG